MKKNKKAATEPRKQAFISVGVTKAQHRKVRTLAIKRDQSVCAVIRYAIDRLPE